MQYGTSMSGGRFHIPVIGLLVALVCSLPGVATAELEMELVPFAGYMGGGNVKGVVPPDGEDDPNQLEVDPSALFGVVLEVGLALA